MPAWAVPEQLKKAKGLVGNYLPNWLSDTLFPTEPDPSLMINPAGAISIYKPASYATKEARVAARQIGTHSFLKTAHDALGSSAAQGAEWFAKRYPRVAAHMRIDPQLAKRGSKFSAETVLPYGEVKKPVSVQFSPEGREIAESFPEKARQTFTHEGKHVAQALGNRNTAQLYDAFDALVGYDKNPFEKTAENAGARAAYELTGRKGIGPHPHANKLMKDILSEAPIDTSEKGIAATKARMMLENRGVGLAGEGATKAQSKVHTFIPQLKNADDITRHFDTLDDMWEKEMAGAKRPEIFEQIKKLREDAYNKFLGKEDLTHYSSTEVAPKLTSKPKYRFAPKARTGRGRTFTAEEVAAENKKRVVPFKPKRKKK